MRASSSECDSLAAQSPASRKASSVVLVLAVAVLKSLLFEQVALHFHFILGPANYVAGPGSHTDVLVS